MKKTISIIMLVVITLVFGSFITISNANSIQPEYDATFNNNNGIFYANGNDIEIKENTSGETIIMWDTGEQIVPTTVTVVGGGKAGTVFQKSNVLMNSGTVSFIYGGGSSLTENNLAYVKESNVKITGGNILFTVYGGGMLYSKVDTSNIEINNGKIAAVVGGGAASVVVSGVSYSAGTELEPQNSKNRVEIVNLIINNGIFETATSTSGLVFGGGQGYSYVGLANLTINGGDLSNAYVTSAGSNGYTKKANTKITGGNIKIFQTVNRGTLEDVNAQVTGGTIEKAYLGGEVDPSVTGIVNKAEIDILGGKITDFYKGTSNSVEIAIDNNNYRALSVENTVTNSFIGEKEIKIDYTINIIEDKIEIYRGEKRPLNITITTSPAGYEYLFETQKKLWNTENEEIAIVDANGRITAKKVGETNVMLNVLEKSDSVNVNVLYNPIAIVLLVFLIVTIVAVIIGLIIFRNVY